MEPLFRNILPVILILLMLPPFRLAAAEPAEGGWIRVDGIVATIDGIPILRSDVLMEEDFGLLEAAVNGGKGFLGLMEPYLNRLLIMRELDDLGGFRLAEGEAEDAFAGYLAGAGGPRVLEEKMRRWGIEEGDVFGRFKEAFLASLYTESRIRFLVKVVPSDIERAYAEDPGRWGNVGLFEAWENIKSDLVGESFEMEKERWLSSLKKRYHLSISTPEEDPIP